MPASNVHTQNYTFTTTRRDREYENMYRHENTNCTPTKRFICLFILIMAVVLIMIGGMVIPLSVTSFRNEDSSQITTMMSATEITTPLETMTIISATTEKYAETASSLITSKNIGSITTDETMTSTTNVDSSTSMNLTTMIISNTKATSNQHTIDSIEPNSTTTPWLIIALNQASDTIIGLYNTTAGESTGGSNGRYSDFNEIPQNVMDGLPTTKYLNFGHNGNPGMFVNGPGIGTGFFVIPSVSNSTVACGLYFATANDNPQRDPITVTLEGSNTSTIEALHIGSSWELIYNGSTGINDTSIHDRETNGTLQNFPNTKRYASYRLLVTSQRGDGDAVQYSEARIMGYI